jgi:hypothetical protein
MSGVFERRRGRPLPVGGQKENWGGALMKSCRKTSANAFLMRKFQAIGSVSTRISIDTIELFFKHIRSGRLPASKLGNRTLILRTNLEKWLRDLSQMRANNSGIANAI